jgi:hypothetical protein
MAASSSAQFLAGCVRHLELLTDRQRLSSSSTPQPSTAQMISRSSSLMLAGLPDHSPDIFSADLPGRFGEHPLQLAGRSRSGRTLSSYSAQMIGTGQMNKAFGSGGPLTDSSAAKGEQQGTRALLAGCSGRCGTLQVTGRSTATTRLRQEGPSARKPADADPRPGSCAP